MRKATPLLALLIAGCSGGLPGTGLADEAEHAVSKRLGNAANLTFQDVRTVSESHQACGHVIERDASGKTTNEQDFVYADRHVSFDNDPDYVMAAVSCDEAQADDDNQQSDH